MSPCLPSRRVALASAALLLSSAASAAPAHAQAACAAVAGNLVQNCGFEQGASGWNFSSNLLRRTADPFYVHSGARGVAGGTVGGLGHLTQDVATAPGQTYTVSFWYRSTGAFTNQLFASFAGQTLVNEYNLVGGDWTQYSFDVAALGAVSTLDIGLRNDPSYDALDDLSVTAASTVTPEPGTWALLASGLAAVGGVARRRRRAAHA